MTAVDLTALKAVAEESARSWEEYETKWYSGERLQDDEEPIQFDKEDAEFIAAASPAAILALVARVEAAEQERDEAEGVIRALRRQRDAAEARLAKVRELHEPDEFGCCEGCGSNEQGYAVVPYPCSTVKALGGEQ